MSGMGLLPLSLLVLVGVIAVWAVVIYNLLVRDHHRVRAAWSDIDVQLKRRHDLIPKLVETVQQHAQFESELLTEVTQLRSACLAEHAVRRLGELEESLAGHVQRLLAVAESYPALKANESFVRLQDNLSQVEDHIQYARRYYNGAVRNLNVRIESFPDLLVARLMRFTPAQYFQPEQMGTHT